MLIIGAEMNGLTGPVYRAYWLDLIASVRGVFPGLITYGFLPNLAVPLTAQSLNDALSFWNALDLIAVSVYHPLSFSTTACIPEFVFGWGHSVYTGVNLIDSLRTIAVLTGKRLVVQELGFRSVDGAATSPGSPTLNGAVDFGEQFDLYAAALSVFARETDRSWLAGVYIWMKADSSSVVK